MLVHRIGRFKTLTLALAVIIALHWLMLSMKITPSTSKHKIRISIKGKDIKGAQISRRKKELGRAEPAKRHYKLLIQVFRIRCL